MDLIFTTLRAAATTDSELPPSPVCRTTQICGLLVLSLVLKPTYALAASKSER